MLLLYFKRNKGDISMSEKIKSIIANQLNIDESSIKEDSTFKDDLGADSLDLFELVMAFEDEYGVSIPSEDLEKITTVGAVVAYLQDKGVEV
jgi:acyl carrier protein